jgi:hypothetical protein
MVMMGVKLHLEFVNTGFLSTMKGNLHLFAHSINFPAIIFQINDPPQNRPCCFSLWRRSAILWAIRGSVAAGAVVDDQIDLDLVFLGFVYDLGRVLDHLRIQHAGDHFVEGRGSMSQEQICLLYVSAFAETLPGL